MRREFVDVNEQLGFTQIVGVEAHGVKTLYVSGQTGGESDDLRGQSVEAFTSLKNRLAEAGATPRGHREVHDLRGGLLAGQGA